MTPLLCRVAQEVATFSGRHKATLARIRRIATTILGLGAVYVSTAGPVLSVPATPSSVPSLVCDVPARTPDQIADLLASTEIATPAATTDGETLPEGVPADTDVAGTMERIVHLWLACQNAGEPLRAWSLFSDGYLYRLLSRQGELSGQSYRAMATPVSAADEAAVVLAIAGERLLPDGRYGATVTLEYPSVPMPKQFFFFFTEIDGRLVIDGILGEISFSVP
jgi:hypothetical protein